MKKKKMILCLAILSVAIIAIACVFLIPANEGFVKTAEFGFKK